MTSVVKMVPFSCLFVLFVVKPVFLRVPAWPVLTRSVTAIRGHWGIENKNHHVKDATMKEDFSRIRINPQNIARLRSFALNIMRHNKVGNINAELYSNVLDFENLLKYGGL